jgi:hypothetical protein
MKTILLSTFIACTTINAFAQEQNNDSTTQTPYENKVNVQYQKLNMIPVSAEDVPKGLKKTLKQSQYHGWERGSILRTPDGKMYQVQLDNTQKTIYRFDAQGKVIEE